ncbi:ArsR/SmtB family transcription factor [Leifsonia sp. AG29]|uniref:ArsR/SmtB family transcription factor n=1 Tax=Leifsonia sp. AG29 TaxID=2598860 RepID=UPI00131DBBC8|nr:metalloregulator ArsR/SmtB family transcription factor [Leifsonia sp. AG29]
MTAAAASSADDDTDAVLRALAASHRRAILRLVANDELSAGQIAAEFEITRPGVSQHLTVLKEAGLVTERRVGTRRLYRARQEGLSALRAELEGIWGSALTAAKALVESDRDR